MDLYAENILDHYRNPRHRSPPPWGEGKGEGVIIHSESNPACGDDITVGINLRNGRIASLKWDGTGCAISQAAMSLLSEEFLGQPEKDIDAFAKENMLALLGVPIGPRRLKCALLGLHTCKNCLRKVKRQEVLGWTQGILGVASIPLPAQGR